MSDILKTIFLITFAALEHLMIQRDTNKKLPEEV